MEPRCPFGQQPPAPVRDRDRARHVADARARPRWSRARRTAHRRDRSCRPRSSCQPRKCACIAAMWSMKSTWCSAGHGSVPGRDQVVAAVGHQHEERGRTGALERHPHDRVVDHLGARGVDPGLPDPELPVRGVARDPHDPVVSRGERLEEVRQAVDGQPLEPGARLRVGRADLDPVGGTGDELVKAACNPRGVVRGGVSSHERPPSRPAERPASGRRRTQCRG